MTNLEVGKLYTSSEHQVLVFPTEERAAEAAAWGAWAAGASADGAVVTAYWSEKLNCHVSVIPGGRVFCAVEQGGETHGCHQVHVVAGESALGWINVADWMNIKKMKGQGK